MSSLSVHSLTDALTDSLRSRITAGELDPGDPITESGLASHYDVARPTAKAAIERLVSEGLLERVAHKSARVPLMNIDRVRDMYFARQVVECESYRRLAESGQVVDDAATANTDLREAAETGALVELVEADVRFHRALIAALSSPRISRVHGTLINEMRLCLVQVQAYDLLEPAVIADEHASILDAIRDTDGALAAERGRAHLEHAESKLLGFLAEQAG